MTVTDHRWNHRYCCECCGISKQLALALGALRCSGVPEVRVKGGRK